MKLKFRIIIVLTSNKGGNFYVWKVYVLHIYITIIVQQCEITLHKRDCVAAVLLVLLLLPITLSYALWNLVLGNKLPVNDKMTASCPTNIPPSQALNQKLQWTEKNFKKLLG